ncbi:MAG: hypothetical protein IIZ61_05565 [Lachnospiraceae bacterium]|nr:hypothetical protein [Lachnospiraceae bacterium]
MKEQTEILAEQEQQPKQDKKQEKKRRKNAGTKKHHVGLIIFLVILVLAIAGVIGYYRYFGSKAYVQNVQDMNWNYVLEADSTEGTISDAATQNIYLDPTDVVQQVFVSEGDTVEIGTPLIQYDTEALSSSVQEAELSLEATRTKLEYEKKRLELDKKIVPVERKESIFGDNETIPQENEVVPEPEPSEEPDDNGGNEPAPEPEPDPVPEPLPEPVPEPEPEPEPIDPGPQYTKEEKEQKIKSQEIAIKRAENAVRQAEKNLEEAKRKLGDSLVLATMPGKIQHVGDPAHIDPTAPFITVQSESGLAVIGYLSELNLSEKNVGDTITVSSWESGATAEATISEISRYPASGVNQWTNGNPNVSWYPYTAYLADTDGFKTGEYVSIAAEAVDIENEIVIGKVYIKNENGKNFVFVDNGSGRLVKKEVKIERTKEPDYYHVTEGLELTDMIAFPYGSKAKEGVKTTDQPPLSLFF